MGNLLATYKASRLGRTITRYGERNGAVLAGGIAYAALFSVFGVLVAGFSLFGLLLGNNQSLFNQVVKATAEALPGLLKVDGSDGAIDPKSLIQTNLFSTAGAIAFLVALFSGLGWVDALRNGVRAFFDIPQDSLNPVLKKLLDVVWLAMLGATMLLSAVLSMGLTTLGGMVLDAIGLSGGFSRFVVRAGSFLIVVLIDAIVLLIVYKWLAGLKLPLNRLRGPLLVGGFALAVLTQFSSVFVGSVGTKNKLFATGALLVTLLVMFNLLTRVVLYVAAWIATKDEPIELEHGPVEPVDLDKHLAATPLFEPTVSTRAVDRTVLGGGITLGVLGGAVVAALFGGARAVRDAVRGD